MRKELKKTAVALLLAVATVFTLLISGGIGISAKDEYVFFESFENGKGNWITPGGGSRTDLSTEQASDGTNSIKITDEGSNHTGNFRSPKIVGLYKGKYHDILVDVYNDSGNATVYVEFWNGTTIDHYNLSNRINNVSSTATVTGKWTTVTFKVSVPDEATATTILLYSRKTNKGVMYFDNIRIKAESEDTQQTILDLDAKTESYPRLYFTASELNTLKGLKSETTANACGFTGSKTVEALLAEADGLLTKSSFQMTYYSTTPVTFTIPFTEKHFTSPPTGYSGSNYPYWQEMGNQMKDMMQTLSLAYSLTGETKYADRAIALMTSLCAWSTWTEHPMVNRTSLETGYFTVGVATVYDMCYDRLTDTQKTAAVTALKEKGLSQLYADLSAFTDHNYYVNKATALAIGSCLVLDKDDDAKKYLSRAYEYIDWYLKERVSSESQEGLSYTSYSMDLISAALDCVKRVTGDTKLMSSEYMDTAFVWAVMSAENGNGYGPDISDVYNNTYFYTTACVMNREQGNALAGWYVSTRNFEVTDFNRIVYYCKDMKIESPKAYTERTGFNLMRGIIPNVGWGVLRTGWERKDMTLVCVANNSSQGHSHFDQNSFVLSLGSGWLLGDPGYQDYGGGYKSDYTLSYGHSTVYVDGKSQDYKGKGTLKNMIDASSYSYLLGSAGGAYKSLSEFDRSFIMVNHSGASYYVIADDLVSADTTAHEYSWVLNAENITLVRTVNSDGSIGSLSKGKSMNDDKFVLSGQGGSVKVSFDSKADITYGAWNDVGSLVTVNGGAKSVADSFCAVISPINGHSNSENIAIAPTVTESFTNDTQNGVRVSYGELSDLILLSKKMGVNAAGFVCDGSSASLFGINGEGYNGYSATDATSLVYNGTTLLETSAPVSASIHFDTGECVIAGEKGTTVRFYLPNGAEGYDVDADGYCTVELTGDKTTININKSENNGAEETTETTDEGEETKNGKAWIIVLSVVVAVVLVGGGITAAVITVKKKKNKVS
ncbi:MAG: heparinase II/III family protein [Clostridia bacterium]|nr:heparinase II/III family protein [Clostridia bacterium]